MTSSCVILQDRDSRLHLIYYYFFLAKSKLERVISISAVAVLFTSVFISSFLAKITILHFMLLASWFPLQLLYFTAVWKQLWLVILQILQLCSLVKWLPAQNWQIDKFLHVLKLCSNFWYFWHCSEACLSLYFAVLTVILVINSLCFIAFYTAASESKAITIESCFFVSLLWLEDSQLTASSCILLKSLISCCSICKSLEWLNTLISTSCATTLYQTLSFKNSANLNCFYQIFLCWIKNSAE